MVKWIDTSIMLSDPLTKEGKPGFADLLREAYTTGKFSIVPTAESEFRKLKAQKARRNTKDKKKEARNEAESNMPSHLMVKDHNGKTKVYRGLMGQYYPAYNLDMARYELDSHEFSLAKKYNIETFGDVDPENTVKSN